MLKNSVNYSENEKNSKIQKLNKKWFSHQMQKYWCNNKIYTVFFISMTKEECFLRQLLYNIKSSSSSELLKQRSWELTN